MNERRHDLDWLRILAFAVLILYHVGMFYVTWDWHVKSSRAGSTLEPLMRLVNPWRLSLLFLVAGAATCFLADKLRDSGELLRSRAKRLGLPLLFGMFVLVPPQSYYEIVEASRALPAQTQATWLQHFYLKYVTASGQWCDADGCLLTPTYNHLWFVAYLLLYTVVLAALLPLLRGVKSLGMAFDKSIEGPLLVLAPWTVMFVLRATLAPVFGQTHMIWADGYLHPLYLGMFLFGFAIARRERFFERCERLRWVCLGIALAAWMTLELYLRMRGSAVTVPSSSLRILGAGIHELQAWTAILAVLGFAHRHLRSVDNRARRVLTEAVFPFYLVHQSLIVVVGHHLDAWQLPVVLEATLLISSTVVGCWMFYVVGRRLPFARPWIGLGPAGSAGTARRGAQTHSLPAP